MIYKRSQRESEDLSLETNEEAKYLGVERATEATPKS